MLRLYNTLTKQEVEFTPLDPHQVTLYSCGPTVYNFAHIGNFRTYAMTDILVRTLRYFGYKVVYVMNITDVGHLVSDSDIGEDKMEKGARREGKSAWDIAKYYTNAFIKDSGKLNLTAPDFLPHATDCIQEQITLVEKLLQKKIAYTIDDGIYFDTGKMSNYGMLTGQNMADLKTGARVEPNPQKRNPTDFALWKFSYPSGRAFDPSLDRKRRDMEWESPWGTGFPGWHIECSAMSMKYLGDQIDIHAGGVDLIPVHHTNEIAQSEAVTGMSPFVRVWIHGQFILVDGEKMAKSKNNFYTISDIEKRGFEPLALRYLFMTAHYRVFLNFTWVALQAAQTSLHELRERVKAWGTGKEVSLSTKAVGYKSKFDNALQSDINMPVCLGVLWDTVKSDLTDSEKRQLVLEHYDRVLGLSLDIRPKGDEIIPAEIKELLMKRDTFRNEKKFEEADVIRQKIEDAGFLINDTQKGAKVIKK
jgi:cysteinyl-tRNA synthetase